MESKMREDYSERVEWVNLSFEPNVSSTRLGKWFTSPGRLDLNGSMRFVECQHKVCLRERLMIEKPISSRHHIEMMLQLITTHVHVEEYLVTTKRVL